MSRSMRVETTTPGRLLNVANFFGIEPDQTLSKRGALSHFSPHRGFRTAV